LLPCGGTSRGPVIIKKGGEAAGKRWWNSAHISSHYVNFIDIISIKGGVDLGGGGGRGSQRVKRRRKRGGKTHGAGLFWLKSFGNFVLLL